MKKKLVCVLMAVMLVFTGVMMACGNEEQPGPGPGPKPEDPTYNLTDNVFGKDEIAATWTSSAAAGKATVSGDVVKIQSTSEPHGGIKSGDAIMDFTKQVNVNFKGFSASESTVMILKMRFAGYSTADSAYIISDDCAGIEGDFSFDLRDAIFRYAGAADNARLIYKEGDIDDDGEEVLAGDVRIGKLKFDAYDDVKATIEIWCMSRGGLGINDAFVAFKEFSITNSDTANVTSFNLNQGDLTGEDIVTVGAAAKQLEPSLAVAAGLSEQFIYTSSDAERVDVSATGLVSFKKVTSSPVTIKAYPRANICKVQSFNVMVQGNITTPAGVKNHFESLPYSSGVATADEDTLAILSGNILSKQKVAVGGAVAGLQLYANDGKITVINAYDKDNADMSAAAGANGGKYTLNLAIANGADYTADAANAATYSYYIVRDGKVTKAAENIELAAQADKFIASALVPYLDNNAKVTGSLEVVVLWTDSEGTVSCTRVKVENQAANQIAKHYSAQEIAETFTAVEGDVRGEVAYDQAADVASINIINKELFYDSFRSENLAAGVDFKTRKVVIVINMAEIKGSVNFRFFATNADGAGIDAINNPYWQDNGFDFANKSSAGTYVLNFAHYQAQDGINTALQSVNSIQFDCNFQVPGNMQAETSPYGWIKISGITFFYVD